MKTFEIDYNNSNMISNLIGDQFYSDWDVFIRELLSNAYDACYTRQALEWSWGTEFLEATQAQLVASVRRSYEPKIIISYNSAKGMFYLEDNGVGINEEDLGLYVSRIGSSYYTSEAYANQRLEYEPIAQFGIGLCSCFRVARAILIESRKSKTINTAWNMADRQSLDPIAAKWFQGMEEVEYINSTRALVGTRVTLALLPKYAERMSFDNLIKSIKKYMIYQPIPIEILYDKKKLVLDQPTVPSLPSAYVIGITTLKIDTELMEGYITLYNDKHKDMVEPSALFQQGFRVSRNEDEIGLKPEWIRNMSFFLNIKTRFLNLKLTREAVAKDEQFELLRQKIGQIIISYYKDNEIGLSQYLNDGQKNMLSVYENEMEFVAKSTFAAIYIKDQERELSVDTIINGFMGQNIKVAFMARECFIYFKKNYLNEWKAFTTKYNMVVFEKNREIIVQFMAPYVVNQHYVVDRMPGIEYIDMTIDFQAKKNFSPYRKNYQAYPANRINDLVFCFVSNEQSGPFKIILNENHPNVQLLNKKRENARVNNLREVIIENIKQRIINSQKHWDKIIDFGGSFVEEWKQKVPMSVASVWCLENDFADSLNAFIMLKFDTKELIELGLEGLVFHREDFISWWYMPRNNKNFDGK